MGLVLLVARKLRASLLMSSPDLELSIVGRSLHQAHHLEFAGGAAGNVEVPRSVYGKLTWRWEPADRSRQ